ncbi:hypothetical protein H9639_15085 [Arthrobacter sp. Sa2CUA1]|uniref:Uncharacterized protein n=1 Tax=Arthrobacter gallicola TaxID=2762225 RepID=A0ABR8UWK0_9MICC|nr:hypothetical protein [Arthrobacter gallicola]MBD7996621.1 hypothetical protein [Arthrobacter gallicola]
MGTYNALSPKIRAADYLTLLPGRPTSETRLSAGAAPEPAALPPLEPGQVYVTTKGTAYHPGWCQVVQRTWEFNRSALQILAGANTGDRRLCRSCERDSKLP